MGFNNRACVETLAVFSCMLGDCTESKSGAADAAAAAAAAAAACARCSFFLPPPSPSAPKLIILLSTKHPSGSRCSYELLSWTVFHRAKKLVGRGDEEQVRLYLDEARFLPPFGRFSGFCRSREKRRLPKKKLLSSQRTCAEALREKLRSSFAAGPPLAGPLPLLLHATRTPLSLSPLSPFSLWHSYLLFCSQILTHVLRNSRLRLRFLLFLSHSFLSLSLSLPLPLSHFLTNSCSQSHARVHTLTLTRTYTLYSKSLSVRRAT